MRFHNTLSRPCVLLQARQARAEIVEKQSIAEMKRTSKIVISEGFLELPKDMLVELTSWNDLTISEVDLYQAVKKLASSSRFVWFYESIVS